MALAAGTKLGPYEIAASIGAGGMGEVYRARDSRLGRDVAVKVLLSTFSADPERLRRFETEARATGALNHPNILAVYDIGTHENAPYVVSELLEGETLRERIGSTPLPTRKAIDYGAQIARGLSAAHEKGIVHRDLKPENLFLTKDGRLKILDFGLAKLTDLDPEADSETKTRNAPGTDAGKVLGTVGYMSPEQVRAKPVDHRSDIFSFGSVLYEMLSGKRAFRGASAVETMNAILKEDPPDLSETNRSLPPALERIVAHCLEKNPEERFQSARDIAFDLEHLSGSATSQSAIAAGTGRASIRWRGAILGLAALALAGLAFLGGRHSVPVHGLPDFQPLTFRRGILGPARFAADGKSIVYTAEWPASPRDLYIAQAGSAESRSLNLENAGLVGVSSSGELAVLVQRGPGPGRTLARLPIGGGAPRDVAENVLAADWAPDGTSFAVLRSDRGTNVLEYPIGKPLYSAVYMSTLRVSPRGDLVAFAEHPLAGDNRGDIAVVDAAGKKTTLSTNWADIRGLVWSPDGREIWFSATRVGAELNLWGVTRDGRERQVYRVPGSMTISDSARDGRLLMTVGRTTMALVGRAPGETVDRDLSWLDWGWATSLSRDGKTLLFGEQGNGGGPEYAVYLRGTDGSPPTLLGKGFALALSPEGRTTLVLNLASRQLSLLPTGAGEPKLLPRGSLEQLQWGAFFPDGKRIALIGNETGKASRLWIQDLAGGDPQPVSPEGIETNGGSGAAIAPDGRWIAATRAAILSLYAVAGGEARAVKGAERADRPLSFSGDGRFLIARNVPSNLGRRAPARLYRLDLTTGTRQLWKELTPPGGTSLANILAIALAPDADSYAYTYYDPATSTLYEVRGIE